MTKLYSRDLGRWLRVAVIGLRSNGLAVVSVLDGECEAFKLEVPVYRLRVQS